jgi:pimeloyl-ACP methyl ester carboxylesterase
MLHVEVHDGSGPFALLVHGMLSGRSQWALNLEALRRVCRPVVVELWGHGRSPAPTAADAYAPDAYVGAFDEVRVAVGAERWVLVGQSLGAALTLRYALDHPERVLAQVFTNSSSALADEAWQARIAREAPATAAEIEAGGADAVARLPIHPARARRLPAAARPLLLADAALADPGGVARTLRHTVPASSVRARAHRTRVPSLLVAGAREPAFRAPRDHAAATIPGLEVVDLHAGHAVNVQAADAFNDAVTAFVARHARGRAPRVGS